MRQNSDEFLRNYDSNIREIIDYVCSIIFQQLPSIREKVVGEKLKYVDVNKGSLCSIYVKGEFVVLEFRSSEKFEFNSIDVIDKVKIEKLLN